MARIEIDPNYSSPTFSRATAAADLFKKEDVQALAAALSTHDHSTGKGIALAAGAIPSGLITSAMIANGTIDTVDLKDASVTNAKLANDAADRATIFGMIGGPSTTSPTAVDVTGALTSITVYGGKLYLWLTAGIYNSNVGALVNLFVKTDGGAYPALPLIRWQQPTAASVVPISAIFHVSGLSAATHTFQLGWSTNAGTVTLDSGVAFIWDAAEFMR